VPLATQEEEALHLQIQNVEMEYEKDLKFVMRALIILMTQRQPAEKIVLLEPVEMDR
jgi:hypothetical protein|tara:strand:- start:10239 stop:10409 length:171 start_codon:yes stop_codon:yes gene_type:complete